MAFKLQPLAVHSVDADFLRVFNTVLKNNKTHSTRDPQRVLSLRASQLPFCPFGFFYQHAKNGMTQSLDLLGAFFTSVGTTVHEVMQTYLGQTDRFLADWECPECGKWHRLTTQPNCCGTYSKYHEVCIDYKGVQGHIDAIFIDRNGNYWILDFKTSSLAGAPKKKTNPGVAYIEQIETYAYFIKKQYGIRVKGVMLCFIPRDNPTRPILYTRAIKKLDLDNVKERFKGYKRAHKMAIRAETKEDLEELVENFGPCTNPYCEICRKTHGKKARLKVMVDAMKIGQKKKYVPIIGMAERANKRAKKEKR